MVLLFVLLWVVDIVVGIVGIVVAVVFAIVVVVIDVAIAHVVVDSVLIIVVVVVDAIAVIIVIVVVVAITVVAIVVDVVLLVAAVCNNAYPIYRRDSLAPFLPTEPHTQQPPMLKYYQWRNLKALEPCGSRHTAMALCVATLTVPPATVAGCVCRLWPLSGHGWFSKAAKASTHGCSTAWPCPSKPWTRGRCTARCLRCEPLQ